MQLFPLDAEAGCDVWRGPQISVVMPYASREPPGESSWRSVDESASLARLQLALGTFVLNVHRSAIREFVIVTPPSDLELVQGLLDRITTEHHLIVVDQRVVLSAVGIDEASLQGVCGWKIQQLIKLAFSYCCKTKTYLTMDCDILTYRKTEVKDLSYPDGRTLLSLWQAASLSTLFIDSLAQKMCVTRTKRRKGALALLGFPQAEDSSLSLDSPGETPVLLHRDAVLQVLSRLKRVHGRFFCTTLMQKDGWTEYALYFYFLEATDALSSYHFTAGRDAVLSLRRSVWEPSDRYRAPRVYDKTWLDADADEEEGPFLAIQSYLPPQSWLPKTSTNVLDFYNQLAEWTNVTLLKTL